MRECGVGGRWNPWSVRRQPARETAGRGEKSRRRGSAATESSALHAYWRGFVKQPQGLFAPAYCLVSLITMSEEPIENNQVIKLQALDQEEGIFELPLKAAILSQMIKDSINYEEDEEDFEPPTEPVQLLRIGKRCLAKVVEFLKHHATEALNPIPVPLGGTTFEEVSSWQRCLVITRHLSHLPRSFAQVVKQEWYQKFCDPENMDQEMLFEVLRAANYLSISPLLDLTCLKVTFQLTGKNAEEVSNGTK